MPRFAHGSVATPPQLQQGDLASRTTDIGLGVAGGRTGSAAETSTGWFLELRADQASLLPRSVNTQGEAKGLGRAMQDR